MRMLWLHFAGQDRAPVFKCPAVLFVQVALERLEVRLRVLLQS